MALFRLRSASLVRAVGALVTMMQAAGCAPESATEAAVDDIRGGTPVSASDLAPRSTVAINGGSCTGVIIGRRYVITASHCRVDVGASVHFYAGATPSGALRYVSRVAVPSGVRPTVCSTLSAASCDYTDDAGRFADLAVLELNGDIPDGYVAAELPAREIAAGEAGWAVGVGGHNAAANPTGRMDWVSGVVRGVYGDTSFRASRNNVTLNDPGDSGGPFFTLNAATNRLVLRGVLFGTTPYESVYSSAFTHLGWIQQQTRQSTYLADVTGDGRADGVAVNGGDIWVAPSNGVTLDAPQRWMAGAFAGARGTFFADVTGDGKADGVAFDGATVRVAAAYTPPGARYATAFLPSQPWLSVPFYGAFGVFVANVDDDHRADLVAVNGDSVWVSLSDGRAFGTPQQWSASGFWGTHRIALADMDADDRADLIAVSNNNVWVMLSDGARFGAPTPWHAGSTPATISTPHVADIDGDHRADVVFFGGGTAYVYRNLSYARGFSFSALDYAGSFGSQAFTAAPRGTVFGDIDGDGGADAMAVFDRELQFATTSRGYWPTFTPQPGFAFYGNVER